MLMLWKRNREAFIPSPDCSWSFQDNFPTNPEGSANLKFPLPNMCMLTSMHMSLAHKHYHIINRLSQFVNNLGLSCWKHQAMLLLEN